jgi:xanthine dehydrogenase/oxidase
MFVDDIPSPQNCLHASLVKSTSPHARILSIDISDALALEGVEGFFDQYDLAYREKIVGDEKEKVFATGVVTCVGQVIGVVVATSPEVAESAAARVRIVYEHLPPVLSIEDAIHAESYFAYENSIVEGTNEP